MISEANRRQGRAARAVATVMLATVLVLAGCGSRPRAATSPAATSPAATSPAATSPAATSQSLAIGITAAGSPGVTTTPTGAAPTAASSPTGAPNTPLPVTAAPNVAPTTRPPPVPATPPRTTSTTAPSPSVGATLCPSTLAGQLATTGGAAQIVTVEAPQTAGTTATVTAWQRNAGCWQVAWGPWPARIGESGFSDHHHEGDGTTPTGAYGIGSVMYGNAPNPGVRYAYHQVVCGDWWDEDPTSTRYNTFQHVPCGQSPPFGGGSEALWQDQTAYPSFAVIDYNPAPATPGAGSAIFVHADTGSATSGCVSVARTNLDQLLGWLNPADAPIIVLGPAGEITRF